MTRPGELPAGAARRCPECGVVSRTGSKYCDFCGTKIAGDAEKPAAAGGRKPAGSRTAVRIVAWLAAGCLAIVVVSVGRRLGQQETPPAVAPSRAEGKRQAVSICESHIRRQVRAPFRVIAFRSALVAEERAGYAVSGTVELQSAAGDLQRKKYWCRVRPDAGAGMLVEDGKLY